MHSTHNDDTITTHTNQSELDSHADTTVAGSNMVMLHDSGKSAEVVPFSDEYEPTVNIPIATCATSYDCPQTGTVYLLIFGQS